MKKIYSILTVLLLMSTVFLPQKTSAQVTEKNSHQAVIRAAKDSLLKSANQLLSEPYTLHAKTTETVFNTSVDNAAATNEIQKLSSSSKTGDKLSLSDYIGKWRGTDVVDDYGNYNYVSRVVTDNISEQLGIIGLGFSWLEDENFWGEEIIDSSYVVIEINSDNNTVNIPEQDYVTTLYSGQEFTYTIYGSGTVDTTGTYPTMILEYELNQGGFLCADWCFNGGYLSTSLFVANLSLDPNDYVATISTTEVINIGPNVATTGGNIAYNGGVEVTARGVVYSTSENPTVEINEGITTNGTGSGSFSSSLSGLTNETTYYARAYATNSVGTAYGEQVSFTTNMYIPTISTNQVINIGPIFATIGGNIAFNGGAEITARGVVYSTSVNPTVEINQGITTSGVGLGSFTSSLNGLIAETDYYARAYAINSVGTAYGEQVSFTTSALPENFYGIYTVLEGSYFRLGVENSASMWVGEKIIITAIDATTFRFENWGAISGWEGNVLYFQIDPATAAITYPFEWEGVSQTLNGQPIITTESNPADMIRVIPLAGVNMNKAIKDEVEGKDMLNMVYGYYTAGSGPREFYFLLEKNTGVFSQSIANQVAIINEVFSYTIPKNAFVDEGGSTLIYAATLADGNALPAWLTFDADTRTFSGTPSEIEVIDIKVTANSEYNSASETFALTMYEPVGTTNLGNPLYWDWANKLGHTEGNSSVIGTAADNHGYLYTYGSSEITGTFLGQAITEGRFLAKHDVVGRVEWIKQFSNCSNGSKEKQIVIDTLTNNVYITGDFTEEFVIPDASNLQPGAEGSVFIIKYATDGTFGYAIKEDGSVRADLAVDNDGNVILTGVFNGTITISGNSLTSAGGADVLIAKYNASGVNQWAIRAGGESIEYFGLCTVDSYNNIYLTGEFTSENITVNQMPAIFNEGDGNTIFAKINSDGETQWIKSQSGTAVTTSDYNSWPTGFVIDKDGNTFMKGWHGDSTYFFTETEPIILRSTHGDYGKYIAKFDMNGNALWAKTINEKNYGFSYNTMDIDKFGNVYFGLDYRDTIYIDEITLPKFKDGSEDLLIAKYTTDGEFDWGTTVTGTDNSWISSISLVNNQVYVAGEFSGVLNFGNIHLTSTNTQGFIAMLNNDLLDISASANPVNGGIVSGTGTYNYGETGELTATPETGYNFVNWTENGTEVSTSAIYSFTVTENRTLVANFVLQTFDILAGVSPANSGAIVGTGNYYYGETINLTATAETGYDFVNWTENDVEISTNITYSFMVIENRTLVANFTNTTAIAELENNASFVLFPNPAHDIINISSENISLKANQKIKICLINQIGKSELIANFVNSDLIQVNVSDVTPGIYFLQIVKDNELTETLKVIITD